MGRGDFANFSANPVYKGFLMGFINMCEMLSTFNLENKECRNMSEVERIVGENRLVRTKTTTKSESKVIQDSTETWETNKKGSGYKKVQIKLKHLLITDFLQVQKRPNRRQILQNLQLLVNF